MARGLNKVLLIGNVGADPVMRYTPDNQIVATWSLATSEQYRTRDGERAEHTEWHDCHCTGHRAEYVRDYVFKGHKLYCEGTIKTRTFKQSGQKIRVKEIKVTDVQILGDGLKNTPTRGTKHEQTSTESC